MAFFKFTVPENTEAQRLDKFLTKELPNYSRSFLAKCKLKVNGKVVKASQKVKPGDKIEVAVPPLKELEINAEKIPLDVIYEDEDILVINKPAGMVVHPTDHGGHVTGTLVNALLHYLGKSGKSPPAPLFQGGSQKDLRPGLVHRIDRDTSGLLVVAKTEEAKSSLTKQFADRKVEKIYLTLVIGNLRNAKGRIDAPIGRDPADRTRRKVHAGSGSREAITEFEVVERFKIATLVQVKLLTGRTHQIRVHFNSLNHPVVGDSTYGFKGANDQINSCLPAGRLLRLFLHAAKLSFTHPKTGEWVEFESELPDDLKDILEKLREA